jgi:hypothetical protein
VVATRSRAQPRQRGCEAAPLSSGTVAPDTGVWPVRQFLPDRPCRASCPHRIQEARARLVNGRIGRATSHSAGLISPVTMIAHPQGEGLGWRDQARRSAMSQPWLPPISASPDPTSRSRPGPLDGAVHVLPVGCCAYALLDYAVLRSAPSGSTPWVTYRHKAISSLRATATIATIRTRPRRSPTRSRNHRLRANAVHLSFDSVHLSLPRFGTSLCCKAFSDGLPESENPM